MISPLQYAIYKGMTGKWGALQLRPSLPYYHCSNFPKCKEKNFEDSSPVCQCQDVKMIPREGCIFMEVTSASGPNKYNWSDDVKIKFALSVEDIAKLLVTMTTGTETKLYHDPNKGGEYSGKIGKTLILSSPNGLEDGVMLSIMEKGSTTEPRQHKVPISPSELMTMTCLFRTMLPKLLAW